MDISQRLYELRKERNLSQKALALELGISQKAISQIENKENGATSHTLILLSKFFKVSTDYLLGLENENGMIILENDLSEDESYFVDVLRQLNQKDKNTLYELADLMLKAKK